MPAALLMVPGLLFGPLPSRPVLVLLVVLIVGAPLLALGAAIWLDERAVELTAGGAGHQVLQPRSSRFVDARRPVAVVHIAGLTAVAAGLGAATAVFEPLGPAMLVHVAAALSIVVLASVLLRGVLAGPLVGGVDAVERAAVDRVGRMLRAMRWPAVVSAVLVVAGAALPYVIPLIAAVAPGLLGYLLVFAPLKVLDVTLLRVGIGRRVRTRWPLPLDDRVARDGALAQIGWLAAGPVRSR